MSFIHAAVAYMCCGLLQFKRARMDPNQIRRPPSAGKGGGKEDAERRAWREAERAQMLAKRVEQTMMKVCIILACSHGSCAYVQLCAYHIR